MNRHDENFKMLAKGVVSQGVEDYKKALKLKWALEHKMHEVDKTLMECEKFFNSEWCKDLSDIDDPHYIIDNATNTAKKEFNEDEIFTVTVKSKLRKKEDVKTEEI